jgi:hypothetical protein
MPRRAPLAVERKEEPVSDSYLGATEAELPGAPLARRLAAYSDQRRLFPHQGTLRLTPHALVLDGWRVIRREAVANVRLTFTGVYRRGQAAGIRGNNASFGLFGDLGLFSAALIVVCVCGCHVRVTVHAGLAPHGSAAGQR